MARKIEGTLYKIRIDCNWTDSFVEAESKTDLFNYILDIQEKGGIITGVTQIRPDGTTPRVAFRGDTDFKRLQKERTLAK